MIRYCALMFVFVVFFAAYVDRVSKDPDSYGDAMKTDCPKVE